MRKILTPSLATTLLMAMTACSVDKVSDLKNTFGTDDRVTVDVGVKPWSALGRLDSGCTGALVGQRLVLTAAHCLYDSAAGKLKQNVTFFRPALKGGVSDDPSWIKTAWIASKTPETDRGRDWAIFELAEPIGEKYGHLALVPDEADVTLPRTVTLAGYAMDVDTGNNATIHHNCHIRERVGERLLHDCDASAGISGAPVLDVSETAASIVAITVSEYRQGAAETVHRDRYEREYANVAIGVADIEPTLSALIATVDIGAPAPGLPDVHMITNTNANPDEDRADPVMENCENPLIALDEDGNPIIRDYSAGVTASETIARRAKDIQDTARDFGRQLTRIEEYAGNVRNDRMAQRTRSLQEAAGKIFGLSRSLLDNSILFPGAQRLMNARHADLQKRWTSLESYRRQNPRFFCRQNLHALLMGLAGTKENIDSLLFD